MASSALTRELPSASNHNPLFSLLFIKPASHADKESSSFPVLLRAPHPFPTMHLRRIPVRPSHLPRTTFYYTLRRSISTTTPRHSILGLHYRDRETRRGHPIVDPETGQRKTKIVAIADGWEARYQARRDLYPLGIPRGPTVRQLTLQKEMESRNPNRIKIYPSLMPSARAQCRDPVAAVTSSQLSVLDPTGARTKLFSKTNPEAAKVGDILLVRTKDGDPFAGVCINIRRRGVDTGILLRDHATRVGVEMWFKVYSPNVEGVEVVQRRVKRARRARLYYMRQPKHDLGSVQNVVQQYIRQRMALRSGGQSRGRDAIAGKRKKKR